MFDGTIVFGNASLHLITSIMVNGCPTDEFKLEKGLRQGDPLSPFLYLIVAEGLNMLISKDVESGLLEAVSVGRDIVPAFHLQYADDTICICLGKLQFDSSIKYLLRNIEIISGLKVNFDKCSIVGVNVGHNLVSSMAEIMRCEVSKLPLSYLGLFVGVQHMNSDSWSNLVERVKRRLAK